MTDRPIASYDRVSNTELMSMLAWFEGDEKPSPDKITRGHMACALRELQKRRDAEQIAPVTSQRAQIEELKRLLKYATVYSSFAKHMPESFKKDAMEALK